METMVAALVSATFVALALWHVQMAFTTSGTESGAVPSEDGKPLFVPSRRATLIVAFALLVFGALVAATAGLVQVGVSRRLLSWSCYFLALGLVARAVGEFKYVGFFKRVRGSKFGKRPVIPS